MDNPGFDSDVRHGYFDVVTTLFCAFLLISNIGATKLIGMGPLVFDGGAMLFPLTYVLGDVLAEVYGLSHAKRAIWLGFVVSLTASIVFALTDAAPAASDFENDSAWHAVLGVVWRMVAASLLGYLAGQFLNAYVLVRIKQRFGEARLWVRLVGSTLVGEAADTTLFCLIAWWGITADTMANYIITGYVWKVLVEVALLPVTYRVVAFVRRREELRTATC
ncbi:MAG: queuosine precursor transporter [Propionibacteriaceae bacterium]|jgi:uncharacterized integral membrane protein (TIGR00697 family)|nr:queuosine precursor transporter [Propionibacteriaceae bacterium]